NADRSHQLSILPQRNAATPAYDSGIAVVTDVETFLRMADSVSNVFGWLAIARRRPCLVGRDLDGRYGCAIHAREGQRVAIGINNGYHYRFFQALRFRDDGVHNFFGFGVVNRMMGLHGSPIGAWGWEKSNCEDPETCPCSFCGHDYCRCHFRW